jgi:hypothetical protein
MKGTLKNYGEVWFCPDGIANILSLSRVKERFPVRYDSEHGNAFVVDGPTSRLVFKQSPSGLFYLDTKDVRKSRNANTTLVNTVQENMEGLSKRDLNQAKLAERLIGLAGFPSEDDFKKIITFGLLKNCPISTKDVDNAVRVFGRNRAIIKGKTTRETPERVVTDYVDVPREILDALKELTLAMDILFANQLPFLVSVGRGVKFTTIEYLKKRTHKEMGEGINHVLKL